eukprot:1713189-Amphidinium_carterae.1
MLFNYTSGEEHEYQVVHLWFEKKKMGNSISYKNENDLVNGAQVTRASSDVPLVFLCYETNASSEGSNPKRTIFWAPATTYAIPAEVTELESQLVVAARMSSVAVVGQADAGGGFILPKFCQRLTNIITWKMSTKRIDSTHTLASSTSIFKKSPTP